MKALLKFTIVVDHDGKDAIEAICLYNEADGLVWRIGGTHGRECETLPRPKTVKQAKEQARACYPYYSPYRPQAGWM